MKATYIRRLVLAGLFAIADSAAQEPRHDPGMLIREQMGVSAAQVTSAGQRGTVLTRVFPEKETKQIGVAGLTRVRVPLTFALAQIEDIEKFKTGPAVLQIGKFSSTPASRDLRSLALEPADVSSLPKCRPGACDLKLSSEMMRATQSEIRGRRVIPAPEANGMFQDALLNYVRAFLSRGREALPIYRDKESSVGLADASAALLKDFEWIRNYGPALAAVLNRQDPVGANGGRLSVLLVLVGREVCIETRHQRYAGGHLEQPFCQPLNRLCRRKADLREPLF